MKFFKKIHSIFLFSRLPVVLLVCVLAGQSLIHAQLAVNHDKYLGCIISSAPTVPENFSDYWNQVTPENASKWGSVERTRDSYNWTYLDLAYDYALDYGFPFRFHVLIWGKQQPEWMDDLDPAEQAEEVEEWFAEVAARYPDLEHLEVVNEAIVSSYDPYPSYYEALGGEGETGFDWVIRAFEMARDYFPDAKLYLNEYNILSNSKSINTYLQIIDLLKERDLIDAVCEQGHYFALKYSSVNTLKSNLDKLAAKGLPICISEFEIDEADDDVQVQKYKIYFPLLWEHPGVEGITLWGYQQNMMWKPDGYLVKTDGGERPALQWLRDYLSGALSVQTATKPENYALLQSYPNPFNHQSVIRYQLPATAQVQVTVYDVRGRAVAALVNKNQGPGVHQVYFDAGDLPSGVYFAELTAGGYQARQKMMLVK